MKKIRFILVLIILFCFQKNAESQVDSSIYSIGKYELIRSKILGESRKLIIHLPDDYSKSKGNYPVLYVLDGDWNFIISSAYVNVLSSIQRIPDMIVVAVLTTNRVRDFLPTHVEQVPESGGSDNFLKFLTKELIPYIDNKYRTMQKRILFGASNSGLYVIYHLLTNPGSFTGYISASPTMRHDDFAVNKMLKESIGKLNLENKSLFISYGEKEGDWLVDPILQLENILLDMSPSTVKWKVKAYKDEGHVPPPSLYDGLKFVFPKRKK